MGIVVLRSTTPCVAVNSRSNSNLLTVISMVPAATAASTGIKFVSPRNSVSHVSPYFKDLGIPLLLLLPYIKCKTYKTSSNSRCFGEVENSTNSHVVTTSSPTPRVRNRSHLLRSPYYNSTLTLISLLPFTASTANSQPSARKTVLQSGNPREPPDSST